MSTLSFDMSLDRKFRLRASPKTGVRITDVSTQIRSLTHFGQRRAVYVVRMEANAEVRNFRSAPRPRQVRFGTLLSHNEKIHDDVQHEESFGFRGVSRVRFYVG